MSDEIYLGDGLYASHDGWQFKLRAPNHDGDHVVYLEPSVLAAFQRYVEQVENLQLETAIDNRIAKDERDADALYDE